MTCTCIRLDCWHPSGKCEEPPVARGGICTTCRYYHPEFVACKLCGESSPRADIVGGVCLTCAEGITFSLNARRGRIIVKGDQS